MDKEIQKDFYEHSATQKRIANNVHKKNLAGRGPMKTTVDFMSGEEKKKYMEAKMVNQIDLSTPMTRKEFRKLRPENRKLQLEVWGNVYGHTSNAIAKVLGCSQNCAYKYLNETGLMGVFKEKRKEDILAGKRRVQDLNLSRISPKNLPEPADVPTPEPVEIVEAPAEAENKPAVVSPVPTAGKLIMEPQNAAQTAQNCADVVVDGKRICTGIVIDGKMPVALAKVVLAHLDNLDDNAVYRVTIVQES